MPDLNLIYHLIAQIEGQPEAPPGGILSFLPPLVIMFLIFYFVLIRPEKQKQARAREMLNDLKEGDNIVTLSGSLDIPVIETSDTLFRLLSDDELLSSYENMLANINLYGKIAAHMEQEISRRESLGTAEQP